MLSLRLLPKQALKRFLGVTVLLALAGAACTTVRKTPGDARWVEAQRGVDEALRRELAGQDAKAVPLVARALAIEEVTLGKGPLDVALSLHRRASLYQEQGQYVRAEPLYERALGIWEAALGKDHPAVASSLNHLALLHVAQGEYARAEPLVERALAIEERALGKEHQKVAASLNNLAMLYWAQGEYAKAVPLLERALAIGEAALGKDNPFIALSLNNLATFYRMRDQYARARPLYERAQGIVEAAFSPSHPEAASTLQNLAELQLTLRHLDAALPLLKRALSSSEEHLRQEVFGLSETRLASVLSLLRDSEERLYRLIREHPEDSRVRHLALSATLLRKGRSAEELANTFRIISRSLSPEDRKAFEQLRALCTRMSALSFAPSGQRAEADVPQRLQELRQQADVLEAQLARRSERFRALHALPAASEIPERVAAALPRDGALVEFVAASTRSDRGREMHYLALLLFADGRTQAVDLGPAEVIHPAVQRLRDALVSRAVSYQPAAQELYNVVFRPLVPHLGGVKRLFLAPEEQLSLVPFAALHDGRRFLVDAWDITYLTSGKDLLRQPEAPPSSQSVVVPADPDFGMRRSTPSRSALASPPASLERFFSGQCPVPASVLRLPGTRQEAEALQRLLPRARVLLGPEATKDALLKLEAPLVLHIATHGFFLEDALGTAGTRAVKPGLEGGSSVPCPADPLLRAGLLLAGAGAPRDGASARGQEASLVTALELAGLDLWGTQLVVLSACDTGRGDVKRGQGVYGLRRALVVAGAETVVTSLWKVNDGTTAELMEGYYRKLLAGEGRVSALHEAMKELRQKRPHPYYWAPFIATGQDGPLRGLAARAE